MTPLPKAVLRALHPRRALPATVPPLPRKPIEALRKRLATCRSVYRAAIARGVDATVAPELAPLRGEAHALVLEPTLDRLRGASLEGLAGFACMTRRLLEDATVMPALLAARGLADLIAIAVSMDGLDLGSPGNWTAEIHLLRRRGRYSGGTFTWLPVRQAVCAATEPDYVAARERARALGETAPPWSRAHLAFAFPDEPWADTVWAAWRAEAPAIAREEGACLLSCCRDPAMARELVDGNPFSIAQYAADLAVGLPEAEALAILAEALPPLLCKPRPLMKTPPRNVATALTYFRSPAGARVLAPYAGHPILGAIVAAYFQDNPGLAGALATGPGGKATRDLAAHVLARAVPSDLPAPDADVELPALLRERPWRQPRAPGAVVEGIALLPGLAERVVLPAAAGAPAPDGPKVREMTPVEQADYVRDGEASTLQVVDFDLDTLPGGGWVYVRVPAALGLPRWNQGRGYLQAGHRAWVAGHGLAALPGFLSPEALHNLDHEGSDDYREALFSLVSPRIAPLVARIAARRKQHRSPARRWLREYAETAALGLIPVAVGPRGADRDDAEAAILYLARGGHAAIVTASAARYGEPVRRAVDALLARDPLRVEHAPPKPPDFLRADRLPALRLATGARLPEAATVAVLEMLSLSTLEDPYPGLARLTELDPKTLAELALALLEQWRLAGAPGRYEWMLHAVAHFPSAEGERKVADLARDWARRDQAKAARAAATLAALGSDAAFLHLGHIAETSRFAGLRKTTRDLLTEAATARGLTREQLEDRTVPDLGLDPDGRLRIAFGRRHFTAALDAQFGLLIRDADGSVSRGLPRRTKDDDAALAKAGIARLKALRADAAAIATRQLRRLEQAMVQGRAFTLADFRARLAGHPVLAPLARALVWRAAPPERPAESRTFRLAEDGTLADLADEVLTLADPLDITVAHPLTLGEEARAWTARFADYEILQPFEQLARATFACPADEHGHTVSSRFAGLVIEAAKLLGFLEARAFIRDQPGQVSAYRRPLPTRTGETIAELAFAPGFDLADLSAGPHPQTLGALRLSGGATFGELTPIAYSELMRDLTGLRRPG